MIGMRPLLVAQSIALFGSGLVFPFYVIFIKEIGADFTEFGIAYALFALSSAGAHRFIGEWSDRLGRKLFLLLNSWGTAVLFLIFPLATHIHQVYALQVVLGVFGAMHKTAEKALVGDFTDHKARGKQIGIYHGWTSVSAALAIITGGYLIDMFTLAIIFYIGSAVMFLGGLAVLRIEERTANASKH